jgi:hypothetical protein
MPSSVDLGELDLSLAAMLAGLAMAEEVEHRLAQTGFDDVRFSHGFVFQHLLREPLTVGGLARAMGVTQQRASKAASQREERRGCAGSSSPSAATPPSRPPARRARR